MKNNLTKMVYVRLSEKDYTLLTNKADKSEQSLSQLIRKALLDSAVLSRQ